MNIHITSLDFSLTEYIKNHIARKLEKLFSLNPQVKAISVVLKKENQQFIVITQTTIQGVRRPMILKTKSAFFYSAIANTRDRLKSVLVKTKSRVFKKGIKKRSTLNLIPGI